MPKEKKEKNPGGRPTRYNAEYHNDMAYKLSLLGLIDIEIASTLDIAESTLNNWKIKHPEFMESLKKGKAIADANVATSLYRRATGWVAKEEKVLSHEGYHTDTVIIEKHYPGDTGAAMAWLKNRQPEKWRERQRDEGESKDINLTLNYKLKEGENEQEKTV